MSTTIASAEPVSLAVRRRPAPREHGADHHRHADRLLRQGRLRRPAWATTSRPRAPASSRSRACSRPCAQAATTSSTRARGIARTSPTCRPTSAGARAGIGAGIGDPGPVRPRADARRARLGDHPRARAAARRADHRQARQGLVLRHRSRRCCSRQRGIRNIVLDRHHHRRVRAHDDARGQRPRLRVPAARATAAPRPTPATTTRRSR